MWDRSFSFLGTEFVCTRWDNRTTTSLMLVRGGVRFASGKYEMCFGTRWWPAFLDRYVTRRDNRRDALHA